MKLKPSLSAPLETECLYGETIEILDEYSNWVYCKLLTDNYHGWIEKKSLGFLKPLTHRVIVSRSFFYNLKSEKSNILNYIPMGANISVRFIEGAWAEVYLSDKYKFKIAHVPTKHITRKNSIIKDWVAIAEQLIGTPYKWGGRDTMGIDCSALLQLTYRTYGKKIPRNTVDQLSIEKEIITDINNLKRGCVVFWEGHVGIMVNKVDCLHSNAFHMKTIIEPLNKIIDRMGSENKIKKYLNFNT